MGIRVMRASEGSYRDSMTSRGRSIWIGSLTNKGRSIKRVIMGNSDKKGDSVTNMGRSIKRINRRNSDKKGDSVTNRGRSIKRVIREMKRMIRRNSGTDIMWMAR